jgi:hypothetical protein
MWRIDWGITAFIAGITAFIVDARHRRNPTIEAFLSSEPATQKQHAKGLANTAYDLIHVGGWALIVAGALLMIMGLIRYSVAARA